MSERTLVLATVEGGGCQREKISSCHSGGGGGVRENISSCHSGGGGVRERTLVLATVEGEVRSEH